MATFKPGALVRYGKPMTAGEIETFIRLNAKDRKVY